jgi:parvulin-like peptidyl-prolyl isomerase
VRRLLALLVAALALVTAACGDLAKPYAAKVNNTRITQASLDRELHVILDNKEVLQQLESGLQPGESVRGAGKGTVNSAFAARLLTRRILLELIHQEVQRRHLKVTAAGLSAARSDAQQQFQNPRLFNRLPKAYRDEVIRGNAEVALMQQHASTPVTDKAVAAYFTQNAAQFSGRCISHILVATKEEADALRAQLDAGADFAQVAKAKSTDPGSGRNGGFLGCFPEGQDLQFVEPFKTAAQNLPVGQISQVVQTQFGFHLIKVVDRVTLDQVKGEIRSQLAQQGGQSGFNTLLISLVRKAKIQVNPRFGHFSKDPTTLGVVPREAPQIGRTTTTAAAPGLQLPPG